MRALEVYWRSSRFAVICLVLVLAGTSIIYAMGMRNKFAAEDFDLLAFQMDGVTWAKTLSFQFRPFRLILMAGIDQLFGLSPLPYRVLSLLLHNLNVVLVFCCVQMLTNCSLQSLATAVLFAFYPRHHEVVLWMAAGLFGYATFFCLVSLFSFILFLRGRKSLLLWCSIVAFTLALTSHEMSATLLVLLPAVEYLCLRGKAKFVLRSFHKYVPFAAVFVLYTLTSMYMQSRHAALMEDSTGGYGFLGVGIGQVKTFVSYLVYLVLPHIKLRSLDASLWTILVAFVLCAGLLYVWLTRPRVPRFWIVWMFATLLPFVLFVPFGNADRYFYLPAVGICALVVEGGQIIWHMLRGRFSRFRSTLAWLTVILYVIFSTTIIVRQALDWRQAGEMAEQLVRQVTEQYPKMEMDAQVYVANLPGHHGYATVFLGGGFQGAMRLNYDSPLIVVHTTRDQDTISQLVSSSPDTMRIPGTYVLVYSQDEQRIVDYTAHAANVWDILGNGTWYHFDW